MLTPREYQLQAARDIWRKLVIEDHRSCLLQAPTGAGKSLILQFFAEQMLKHKEQRTLVVAHRREIVLQTARHIRNAGVPCGIIMADMPYNPSRAIQVASINTLQSWVGRGRIEVPDVGLLVEDEAHRSMSKMHQEVITGYLGRGAKVLGMTATPIRTDGVGLGRTFESMVRTPGIGWMIEHGFLVPVEYRVGIVPELGKVKLTAGDYNQAQLQDVMQQKLLIGDVVENWLRHARGRPTVVFCSGVKHSQGLVEKFGAAGVRAVHVDGYTKQEVRDEVAAKMESGEIEVVCNAAVYVEGTDIPCVSCIVLAQPTKSVGKYLQMAGRGLRPHPASGKRTCMILDHAGAVYAHGRVELDRPWQLTQGKEMLDGVLKAKQKDKVRFTCPVCGTLHTGLTCPNCSSEIKLPSQAKAFLPATLVDLTQAEYDKLVEPKKESKKPADRSKYTFEQKARTYAEILGYAKDHSKSLGWCAHTYRDMFGVWPRGLDGVKPTTTGSEVASFIRHKNIAYARGLKYRQTA